MLPETHSAGTKSGTVCSFLRITQNLKYKIRDMKEQFIRSMKIMLTGIILISAGTLHAQLPTYTAFLKNDLMTANDTYEFDLYLSRTGTLPLELANFQAAILVDPAFVNGGTITPAIIGGGSELNTLQQPASIGFSASESCIKIAPEIPPRTLFPETQTSSTDGTIISTEGTRVCRIRLSNSVPFGNTQINPIWNFTVQPYRTAVTAYTGPDDQRVNTFITLAESHSKTLNLTLLTEGLYNPTTGLLNKTQDVDDDYNSWDNFPGLVADTLSILLAQTSSPWNTLWAVHGVSLNQNGHCRIPVPGNLNGTYYIVAKHRNSVETWSKAGGESFASAITSFDLSNAASQAYGQNLKPVTGGKYVIFSGDVSSFTPSVQDGYIDFFDLTQIYNLNVNSAYGYQASDLTGEGFVDFIDLIMTYNNSTEGIGMNTPPNPAKRPGASNTQLTE
jgi:hypothetical protein